MTALLGATGVLLALTFGAADSDVRLTPLLLAFHFGFQSVLVILSFRVAQLVPSVDSSLRFLLGGSVGSLAVLGLAFAEAFWFTKPLLKASVGFTRTPLSHVIEETEMTLFGVAMYTAMAGLFVSIVCVALVEWHRARRRRRG